MDTFNLTEVVKQALQVLELSDASAKKVKAYRNTGFGAALRHFTRQGVLEVSAEMLDSFVLDQRGRFERKEFSYWKWMLVRRGGELLKYFALTETVGIEALRPWDPVLRKPYQSVELDRPTPEQLADPDDLFALIWRIRQALLSAGLTKHTVRHYTEEGMSVILRKHKGQGLTHYSEALASDAVAEIRSRYEQGLTARVAYQNLRKASFWLAEMHRTGRVTFDPVPHWGLRQPALRFSLLLQHFCDNANRTGLLAKNSVNTVRSVIRAFFFELEASGRQSFDGVTLAEISETLTQMAKRRYTSGLHTAIYSVRIFLRHLYENGFTRENLSLAIPEMVARRTIFREGFTDAEIVRLLDEPDLETAIGKRDYAIMLLATQTGLRACDVVNLKRENIDWRAKEIRIVQQKTGKPQSLPLETESGNAVAEYLLTARPESDLPYIFLCHVGVLRPINTRSASGIVTKYLHRAEIVSTVPRRGFHSFRRSFGTRLLQNEIPLEMLRQLLGHSKIDSAKPYLSVDEQGLKSCALGLVSCGKTGEPA